jgi:quercetin dioxygenase-like cupin family protein
MSVAVMVDLGWPWWVTSLIAVGVTVAAGVAFLGARNPAVRAVAALLALQGVAIAIAAPFVMDEDGRDEAGMTAVEPASPADELFAPPQVSSPAPLRWGPVPGVPKGMEGAGLYGDPSKTDLYALRIRMPDGYLMPPHLQPETEILTVIHGTMIVGLGERFDRERAEVLRAGSVSILPARKPHYFLTMGETIVQVEGIGPLDVEYVNPADVPGG